MTSNKKIIIGAAIIILLTSGVYLNSINNPLHFDDYPTIVENPYIRDLGNVPDFFTNPKMFSGLKDVRMYRPVLLVTYALNYKIGEYNPIGYHIVNILLHTLNTLLIYFILLFLLSAYYPASEHEERDLRLETGNFRLRTAFMASLLFGVHTLNTQAVNYISSRSVLLATFFYLLSFYLYIKVITNKVKAKVKKKGTLNLYLCLYFLSLLSFALSLLSKEIAITLPLILLLYDYSRLRLRKKELSAYTSTLAFHIPYWVITAGYLLLRKSLMGRATINLSVSAFTEGTGTKRSIYINLLTQAKANLFYIKSLFLPTGLSVDHDMKVAKGIGDTAVILSILIISLIIAFAVILHKKNWGISLGILWFFIATTPESVVPLNVIINEHRAYLPMVGFVIFCGFFLHRIKDGRGTLQRAPTTWSLWAIATGIFILFTLFNAFGTISRNRVWKDEYTLWKDTSEKYPNSVRAHIMLGFIYQDKGLLMEAMEEYKIAVSINPTYPEAHNNIGTIYHKLGMFEKAIEEYEIAIRLRPGYEKALRNLNKAYAELEAKDKPHPPK